MSYCIYLRKSRADMEAEARGEGETLARHEAELMSLCRRMDITPSAVYREIVSGETIAARPVMQRLLSEVQAGVWEGVLVMEIERLARGDTIDQGVVAQAFQISSTKIITPRKTFDPTNEFDEEYFEFGLFMSRREYKTILRRMQTGRALSVREGKYVGSVRPYGYNRVKIQGDKGFTLEPIPEEAQLVDLMGEWYLNGYNGEEMGCQKIVHKLNSMGATTVHGKPFTLPTVRDILTNPLYAGMLRWNRRKGVKQFKDGKMTISRPTADNYMLVDGLHPPIWSKEKFYAIQEKFKKNPPRPVGVTGTIKNPFAGLMTCSVCGRAMIRRPYSDTKKSATLICQFPGCATVGSQLDAVEKQILQTLSAWSTADQLPPVNSSAAGQASASEEVIQRLEADLAKNKAQLNRLYDLLEQGVYSTEVFVERSAVIKKRIAEVEAAITAERESASNATIPIEELIRSIAPKAREILAIYTPDMSPAIKNRLFCSLIDHITYTKTKKYTQPDLTITPKKY